MIPLNEVQEEDQRNMSTDEYKVKKKIVYKRRFFFFFYSL